MEIDSTGVGGLSLKRRKLATTAVYVKSSHHF